MGARLMYRSWPQVKSGLSFTVHVVENSQLKFGVMWLWGHTSNDTQVDSESQYVLQSAIVGLESGVPS